MKDIAIYGAGGYGREVACLINAINAKSPQWNIIGFFDDGLPIGSKNQYGVILGGMSELNSYAGELSVAMAIGNPKILNIIVNKIVKTDIDFPNLVAPDALFYDVNSFSMGKGNIIGFKSMISCDVHLGNFNLLNISIFLGHDVNIGNCNMFNPSVRISGEVTIGDCNFFGVNSVVLQQKKIGNQVTVGASSVIIRKTQDSTTYVGNPATKLKV